MFWYLQREFLSFMREFSGGKLKQKGFFHSAFSFTTAYTSLVGVSDMHMNRNRKSFTIVSGCRKVKPINSSTHIKNINMIALK